MCIGQSPTLKEMGMIHEHTAHENYFDNCVVLYGTSLGHGDKLGQHTFPFQFKLPPVLPSSFEHTTGQVRYFLKAIIDKPWKFDHTTKLPFTVVSLLDLNTIPEASKPVQYQAAKTLCCLCCKSGPITGVIRIEKTGYVPGEAIYLQGEVQNSSDTDCSVKVKLKMLHINPSSMSTRLVVPVDVIIGSIPLRNVIQQYRPPTGPIGAHEVSINFVGGASVIPSAPEMPPPTYAECVFGKSNMKDEDDNDYTKGQKEYAPAYPYYNLS